ncbi:MAG: homoserine dehydrogenase [Gudongella sp.]|nr:homoserine dehydrogenase [Gudongella sp.]
MRIGIIGLGGVGRAFLSLVEEKKGELIKMGAEPKVVLLMNSTSACVSDEGMDIESLLKYLESVKDLSGFEGGFKWNDFERVLNMTKLDFLIEATPTNKESGEPARTHIEAALKRGINVVTANKGPVLLSYKTLKDLADKNNVGLGIGCTTGGALPTVSSGQYDLLGAKITGIRGILNGTTNYILNLMETESISYDEALRRAQHEGIAETNPSMDVEGWDTATKMIIIANALMGTDIKPDDAKVKGIVDITPEIVQSARDKGKRIKLMGRLLKIENGYAVTVQPEEVDSDDIFFGVNGKNKGILYSTDTLGDVAILGGASNVKGAAASLLRDVLQIELSE